MSDIKAGDVVMVVKPTPCCGSKNKIGFAFRVVSVIRLADGQCWGCGKRFSATIADVEGGGFGPQLSRLIRIDPPALPESVETEREVNA